MWQLISGKVPPFRKWVGMELSEDNNLMLYIPAGFAHGFVVVSKMADVMYKCTRNTPLPTTVVSSGMTHLGIHGL